jgi:hypothetical protein
MHVFCIRGDLNATRLMVYRLTQIFEDTVLGQCLGGGLVSELKTEQTSRYLGVKSWPTPKCDGQLSVARNPDDKIVW